MAKGNAKTELAAHIALAELAGPYAPVAPNIPVSAASWHQANRIFGAARLAIEGDRMTRRGPLAEFFRPGDHLLDDRILLPDGVGSLYRIAAVGGTNDGGLPTFPIGDELHEWETEAQRRVYVVQGKSLRKRRVVRPGGFTGGIQLGITTAGDQIDSLLGSLYEHGKRVASGETVDAGFLFLWWEADDTWDLDDPAQRDQAIFQANPADGEFLPHETVLASFNDPTVPRDEFVRYNTNRFVAAPKRWITDDLWAGAQAKQLPEGDDEHPNWPAPGTPIVLAFDGSDRRDSTAIVGCTLDGYVFEVEAWEPHPGNPVPRREVDAVLELGMERWDVIELAPDPPGWHAEIEDWEEKWGDKVVRFDTNQPKRFGPACDRFRTGVIEHELTHDGSPGLARHVANAVTRVTPHGRVITKDYADSPRRIDRAAAAAIAYERATARQEPADERPFEIW